MGENWTEPIHREIFSCRNCGTQFTVYPPYPELKKASLNKCHYGCYQTEKLRCSECNMKITIFWCTGH